MGDECLESLRSLLVTEAEKWLLPPTASERKIAVELSLLPTVQVIILRDEIMSSLGMQRGQCHANTIRFIDQVGGGNFQHVFGWRIERGLYILHSVLRNADEWICVTPTLTYAGDQFDFIPDPFIEVDPTSESGLRRKGLDVPGGVRANPERTIEMMKALHLELLSGKNPYAVMHAPSDH